MRQRKKKSLSRITKIVPLSVAVTMLTTGMSFAGADYDMVKVDDGTGTGNHITIDVARMSTDADYAANMKALLTAAFQDSKSILVYDDETDTWVEYGQNAREGITLSGMMTDPTEFESDKY